MHLRATIRVLVLELVVVIAVKTAPAQRQSISPNLDKSVTNYNLGEQNLVGGLIRVSTEFHVPIGLAWVDAAAARAKFTFAWKQTTVRGAIEDIVKSYPEYRVRELDEIVHVFPTSIPDRQNFLKARVGPFELHNAVEVGYWKLHTLLAPPRTGSSTVSIAGPADEPVINVDVRDSTVEAILDQLAVLSTRKIWIVTFADDQRLSRGGLRRSISLWSRKTTADDEIPTWDTLRWGDPNPPGVKGEKE